MSIVSNISFCEFCDAFRDMDRNENFSYQGKKVLFNYLEGLSEDTGNDIELDVIALCCEYYENDTDTIVRECRIDIDTDEQDEAKTEQVRDYLNDNTIIVGEVPGGFVYAAF